MCSSSLVISACTLTARQIARHSSGSTAPTAQFWVGSNRQRRRRCYISLAHLLDDLVKNPIDDVRILLVFRSDYRPLVFKLHLPSLVAGQNWQELAPYDRGEATVFLQSGGRELSSQSIERLFRVLHPIEETPGIYRPITLNIVGLV